MALVLAGTALASGCQTTAGFMNGGLFAPTGGSANASGGRFDCFREPAGGVGPDFSDVVAYPNASDVKNVADQCLAVATHPGSRDAFASITRAHFYAGRANLELGRRYLDQKSPEGQTALGLAAQELETVASNTRGDLTPPPADTPGRRKAPASDARRNLAIKARLELAQTYELLQRPQDAIDRITQILSVDPTNAEASYTRAKVIVNRGRRGDIEALTAAVNDLSLFAGEAKNADPPVRAEGRKELVARGRELGGLTLRTQTTDATLRSIDAFSKAAEAASRADKEGTLPKPVVSEAFSDLGNAQLQMAGLSGPKETADFGCAANAGAPSWVTAAFNSFGDAVKYDPNQAAGHAGKGCALQAQGNTNQAIEEFQRAASLEGQNVGYLLRWARALDAAKRPSEAEKVYNSALDLAHGDKPQTARIYVQIADIHMKSFEDNGDPKELDIVGATLDEAVKADATYAPARVMRGNLYFVKRRSAYLATADLLEAASSAKFTSDKGLEADAYHGLSRIKMDSGAAADAIEYAKKAADIGGKPIYREQACLAYIRFLNGARLRDGPAYCDAGRNNPPLKAVLREGMYYLRTTFFTRRYEQDKGWEHALDAFEYGLKLADSNQAEQEQAKDLKSQLILGKGFALGCIGLAGRGNDVIRDVGDKNRAAAEFEKFGIGRCATRYRY
jgi:tetratricopeptide (TPR) repeat protein